MVESEDTAVEEKELETEVDEVIIDDNKLEEPELDDEVTEEIEEIEEI